MMTTDMILSKLEEVFRELFDEDELALELNTSSSDISGWDSLMHIKLIAAIEDEFNIKFKMDEVFNMSNVEEMVTTIIRLTSE